jgi:heme-degrading monooxygenase HmoA
MALMRTTWGKVRPDGWPSFLEEFNRVVDPSLPGLIKRTLVRDLSDPDAFFILALWETETAMKDIRTKQFMEALKPLLLGDHVGSVCDVVYEVGRPD